MCLGKRKICHRMWCSGRDRTSKRSLQNTEFREKNNKTNETLGLRIIVCGKKRNKQHNIQTFFKSES